MSAPRHLWSGDWREESAAAAETLASRRSQSDQPAETRADPLPTPADPPPPPAPSIASRALAWLRATRQELGVRPQLRRALLIGLLALLSAGAAYGVVSVLIGSDGQPSAAVSGGPTWLGVDLASSPLGGGALVASVVPGGPGQAAGLQPGDVIVQIDTQAVSAPSDVSSAIAGMHAGDQVQLRVLRGPLTYTMQASLAARPAGYP